MSNEKKQNAENVERYLRQAEISTTEAEKLSQKVGDKTLTQKVTKIRESVTETRKELSEKLKNG